MARAVSDGGLAEAFSTSLRSPRVWRRSSTTEMHRVQGRRLDDATRSAGWREHGADYGEEQGRKQRQGGLGKIP